MDRVVRVVVITVVIYGLLCAGLFLMMRQPPVQFARFVGKLPGPVVFVLFPFESLWMKARSGSLKPGDPAPDFALPTLDKSGVVRLASFRGQKPVVLVFGSYT
jgi:hypothetical protein